MARVRAYIDGFNFYHGLMAKGWSQFRWLDYEKLVDSLTRPDDEIVSIKYFTSLMKHQPEKLMRQKLYLKAIEAYSPNIEIVEGEFEQRPVQCRECLQWYKRPQEKKTDVSIATHLVSDAYEGEVGGRYDEVLLICADSDLVPAVDFIRRRHGKWIFLVDPPRRHSADLAAISDQHIYVQRRQLRDCQLPNPVEYNSKKGKPMRIHAPEGWVA